MKELIEIQYSIYNGELFSYRETPIRKIIFENEQELRDFVLVEETLMERQNPECKIAVRPVYTETIRSSPPMPKKEVEVEVAVDSLPQWRKPKFKNKQI